jgi:hypothetical protein
MIPGAFDCFLFTHSRRFVGFIVCGGWDLAPSIMRTMTMLAAGTSIASLSCWY